MQVSVKVLKQLIDDLMGAPEEVFGPVAEAMDGEGSKVSMVEMEKLGDGEEMPEEVDEEDEDPLKKMLKG